MSDSVEEVAEGYRARAWGMLLHWFMRNEQERDPTMLKNAIASLMVEARADGVREERVRWEAKEAKAAADYRHFTRPLTPPETPAEGRLHCEGICPTDRHFADCPHSPHFGISETPAGERGDET